MFNSNYFVIVFIEILTLVIGFYLGIMYLQKRNLFILRSSNPRFQSHSNTQESNVSPNKTSASYLTLLDRLNLFDLEVRVLSKLLVSGCITVNDFNDIVKLSALSKENQRQRRHLFIKELNLKLYVINGCRENITRIDDQNDKRSKLYCLSESLDKEMLKTYLTAE